MTNMMLTTLSDDGYCELEVNSKTKCIATVYRNAFGKETGVVCVRVRVHVCVFILVACFASH